MDWVYRLLRIERHEAGGVVPALLLFFLLFTGYFMLRPVRDTMGIVGGVNNLKWLFTATFVSTLACMPLFGWLAGKVARRHILPWTYVFFAANLALFAIGFKVAPEHVWLARIFYVWLSVFNLLAISVAWSQLADLFPLRDAKRLFGLVAAGASAGGVCGPLLGTALVGLVDHWGLVAISTLLLGATLPAGQSLQRWRDDHPVEDGSSGSRRSILGGSPFAGATTVLNSPFLLGIAAFVVLLARVTTVLHIEQSRLVELHFSDNTRRTQFFGMLDVIVQTLAMLTQVFLTSRIAERLGLRLLLTLVPLVVALGFFCLAVSPILSVFVVVLVVRRAGEYALVRPGREMLFTRVSNEAKFKAKNFIDTTVYRGADAVSAWTKAGVDLIGQHPAVAAIFGAAIALVWAAAGNSLARQAESGRERELD
jgi:ATP:ADP antiporter, AAA family